MTAKRHSVTYRGSIVDRMTGCRVYVSRACACWEIAQRRAEAACKRRFGRDNARYSVSVGIREI